MKKEHTAWVIKTSGEREPFSLAKLRHSLRRAGADEEIIESVVSHVLPELRDGLSTSEIYRHAFTILKKKRYVVAARYSLRRAVLNLGPSGFPFEKFIAEILKKKGYQTKTGVVLPGFCVTHEVDVLAEKDDRHIFVEAKFHNQLGIKSDVKVALYVYARFLDLQKGHDHREDKTPKIHEGWLVTNTKLTHDAIAYAQCAGLKLIGWDYPHEGNLQDLIMETKVHPLTCLTTLSASHKTSLLNQGIVMCTDLQKKNQELKALGFSPEKIAGVMSEIDAVCQEF
ncbi:MAG: ATP-cone domain protein [Parcubacteria group bacterium GW2011_GWA1_47_8]|nr:MAG: ATP-cone domain protein [Parcubacteria group bacterium GW2011_GWA1_47_8]KKW07219.1 MAG: ATP-cone domain protein [Parcubacteria group bacterium GW2011_GWA2_49_16]